MRRHVKPALPTAVIPDPERRRDLPPEGYPVTWSVHWERMLMRGDIIASDIPEPAEATADQSEPEASTPAEAAHGPVEPEASEPHPDA